MRQRLFASAVIVIVALSILFNFYLILLSGSTAIADSRPGMSSSIVAGSMTGTSTLTAAATPNAAATASATVTEKYPHNVYWIVPCNDSNECVAYINATPNWLYGVGTLISSIAAVFTLFISIRVSRRNRSLEEVAAELKNTVQKFDKEISEVRNFVESVRDQALAPTAKKIMIDYEKSLRNYLDEKLKRGVLDFRNIEVSVPEDMSKVYVPLHLKPYDTLNASIASYESYDPIEMIRRDQRYLEQHIHKADTLKLTVNGSDSLLEAMSKDKTTPHHLVLANSGGGQSTLLMYLAWQAVQVLQLEASMENAIDLDKATVPIYLDVATFASSIDVQDGEETLLDFVADQVIIHTKSSKTSKELIRKYIKRKMDEGQILLLLNGLDESERGANSEEAKKRYEILVKKINIITTKKQSHVIVSQSKLHYRQHTQLSVLTVNKWEILDFCPEDIRLLIQQWFNASLKQNELIANGQSPYPHLSVQRLIALLDRHPRFQDIASNPLLLTYIVAQYSRELAADKVPFPLRDHAIIFKNCIEILLQKIMEKSEQTDHKSKYSIVDQKILLRRIAWHLHKNYKYTFEYKKYSDRYPEDGLREVIKDLSQEKNTSKYTEVEWLECLDELISRSGIFKYTKISHISPTPTYRFSHLALQEYLIAEAYIEERGNREVIAKTLIAHNKEPWWQEIIVQCISMEADDTLLKTLIEEISKVIEEAFAKNSHFHAELVFKARTIAAYPRKSEREDFSAYKVWLEARQQLLKVLIKEGYPFAYEQIIPNFLEVENNIIEQSWLKELIAENDQKQPCDKDVRITKVKQLFDMGEYPFVPIALFFLSMQLDANNGNGFCRTFMDWYMNNNQSGCINSQNGYSRMDLASLQPLLNASDARIPVAYAIGLLGNAPLALDVIGMMENATDAKFGWAIAYSVAMMGNYSNGVIQSLLDLLTNASKLLNLRWSAANVLNIFALFGNFSIIKQLNNTFNDLYKSVKDKSASSDDELLMWHLAAILHTLNFKIDKDGLKNLPPIPNSQSVTTKIANALRICITNELNGSSVAVEQLGALLKDNGPTLEEQICIVDILARIAYKGDIITELTKILDNGSTTDRVLQNSLYRAMCMIDQRVRAKHPST